MDEKVKAAIFKLAGKTRDAVVCSVDDDGYPAAKAMFRCENEGLKTFWFSTNTSANRTRQFKKNPKACIYFLDSSSVSGVSFTGSMKVHDDNAIKLRFWHKGDEKYYPLGPTDPDYSIFEFTAEKGNYYKGLQKHLFKVSDIQ